VKSVLKWASIASAPLGLSQLLLVYGINRQLGIPDTAFAFGDSLVLTVLGQLAFMPLLVLAAEICPPGVEGTLFAALMSVFNGAGVVGSEAGALLTKVLGVTENNFEQLGLLVAICNLSSLLPLLAIGWIDETVVGSSATAEEGAHAKEHAATLLVERPSAGASAREDRCSQPPSSGALSASDPRDAQGSN